MSLYKPCNCPRPHLTTEHLYATPCGDGSYKMANPYFDRRYAAEHRGRPRKGLDDLLISSPSPSPSPPPPRSQESRWTPKIGRKKPNCSSNDHDDRKVFRKPLTTKIKFSNGTYSTLTPVSSPEIRSKYDVWYSIKNSFQDLRKLSSNGTMNNPKAKSHVEPFKSSKKLPFDDDSMEETVVESDLIFNRPPFRPPPGSINGVTVFSMKNPFAIKGKGKVPIDELTLLFYQKIDEPVEEPCQLTTVNDSIDENSTSSPNLFIPLTPVSPTSPESTTSLQPMESPNNSKKVELENEPEIEREVKVQIEGGDTVVFKEFSGFNPRSDSEPEMLYDGSEESITILDDICIADFNEYEFERMISDLPDIM